ncbi:MAG TPA: sensor histidine kinase [Nitrososphaeraceae archaeon]|nr:sensor histidine kinase [Nitrososphaeraceae archaeon]
MGTFIFSRKNIVVLLVITLIGISLSIISFRYSAFTADEIARIASVDVRSNARIEAHDLSQILLHTLESVANNLRSLSNSQPVQEGQVNIGRTLLNNSQYSTSELTEGYYWLDKDGKLIAWSSQNSSISQGYLGLDLSTREFYKIPQASHAPFYSNAIESPDVLPRFYISYPIMATSDNDTISESFEGVIVAVVNLDSLGAFLQNEISPEFISNVGLMDKNGTILYARNQSLIGKNYESDDFQATIPEQVKAEYIGILTRSLESNPGDEDITFNGTTTTISYQPINVDGERLWTLFLGSPHDLATDTGLVIEQQKNLSSQIIIVIALIAIGIAVLILSWNRKLEKVVRERTEELEKVNVTLGTSNRLLAKTNEQLQAHDRIQKEFIDIAAHELRTPILPILSEAEFLSQKFRGNKSQILVGEEQIKSIILNAKRLDRLASDILDVTRIESKTLKLSKEIFDIDQLIQIAIRETTERQLSRSPRNLVITYEPFHCTIFADRARILQVITNLIDNAVKFTDEGQISINVIRKDHSIEIKVKDTGPGIDNQIMPNLFSKFVSSSENGTGLGLFISKKIVDAHGGKIWAENNDIKGATFCFTLPMN